MKTTMEKNQTNYTYPLITMGERLLLLKKIKGIWKNKKPDPIKELKKMRQEWDRKIIFK
ncbi:hypothetical protein HY061_02860 [Candidatus Azambacteria bacterium]|nr:hypothetical protein [Candidatus Azambacteria bacterium]